VQGATALEEGICIGSGDEADVKVQTDNVAPRHAEFRVRDGMYYVADCGATGGTWLNGRRLAAGKELQLHPGDFLSFGGVGAEGVTFKVKLLHRSQREAGLLSSNKDGTYSRFHVSYKQERQNVSAIAN
jgi:predicted component of type VI protein secretion system